MCLNAATSVTIPLSGQADVTVYDQSCNPLSGANCNVFNGTGVSFPAVTGTTAPAVAKDAAGLHFTVNGAAPGTAGTFTVQHVPSGKTMQMTYVVGAAITAISAGTTTP